MDTQKPTMNSCQVNQAELKAYMDGELPHVQRISVWWHLLRCAECREARKAMTEISGRLTAGETDLLDPGLRMRILSSVKYVDTVERPSDEKRDPLFRLRLSRPLLLAGGGTVAALALALLLRPFPPNSVLRDEGQMSASAPYARDRAASPAGSGAGTASKFQSTAPAAAKSAASPASASRSIPLPDAVPPAQWEAATRPESVPAKTEADSSYKGVNSVITNSGEAQDHMQQSGRVEFGSKSDDRKTYLNNVSPVGRPTKAAIELQPPTSAESPALRNQAAGKVAISRRPAPAAKARAVRRAQVHLKQTQSRMKSKPSK